jgi:cell wall-associated NlpC family hydrolase
LSHTGIYIGNGEFVHAADERRGVVMSPLWDDYWGPRLVGATRALA